MGTRFLDATRVVDWDHPQVRALAERLGAGQVDPIRIARRCFEWVRDDIKHTHDHRLPDVVCAASEVLQAGHGFCYAKSHLLAALLRANGIPAGFCYQRLALDVDRGSYCLHGLNAIQLPRIGWFRVDARGNRAGVDAQFDPPAERLAFPVAADGEADLPEVWAEPLPVVVDALRRYRNAIELADALPDVLLWNTQQTRASAGSSGTMTLIEIRPADSGDDEAIWAMFQEVTASGDSFAFSPETPRQQGLDIWLGRDNTTYVALLDQQIVGSYYLKPNQPGLGAHVCNAGYMVARRARGRGVGRAMGEHSLSEAQRLGYRAMQFNLVVTTNVHAVSLWKSLGFHVAGTLPQAFRHSQRGFVDALVMYRCFRLTEPVATLSTHERATREGPVRM